MVISASSGDTPRDALGIDQIDLPPQFEARLANGGLAALRDGNEGNRRATAGGVYEARDLR
jgi:hypothetical protein